VVGNDKLKAAMTTAHPDDLLEVKSELGAEDVTLDAFLKLNAEYQQQAVDSLMAHMKKRHAAKKGR
jgi:hypothetical protein